MRDRIVLGCIVLSALMAGCEERKPHPAASQEPPAKATTQAQAHPNPLATQPVLLVGAQPVSYRDIQPVLEGIVSLHSQEGPPVKPKCELEPLYGETREREYFTCDLNGDGSPEYFVEDWAGVHRQGYAVIDRAGKPLTALRDVGEIGGDRILVLSIKHYGYHDILCSDIDPGGIQGYVWEFNGRRYVQGGRFHYRESEESKAFIENKPGAVEAAWYADGFAWPRDTNGHKPSGPRG
jgi:hypothetical protein